MNESKEAREKLENLIKRWVTIEENAIDTTAEMLGQTNNPVLKTLIDIIKRDSEKHKEILQTIQQHFYSTVTFTPEDMKMIDTFIDKHAHIEKNALELAERSVVACSLPIPKMLLRYLVDDERKHDLLLDELEKIKAKDMPTQ